MTDSSNDFPKPPPVPDSISTSETFTEPEPIKIENGMYLVNLSMPAIAEGVRKYTAEAVTLKDGDEEVGMWDFSYLPFKAGEQVIRLETVGDEGEKLLPQVFRINAIQNINPNLKIDDFQPLKDGEVLE